MRFWTKNKVPTKPKPVHPKKAKMDEAKALAAVDDFLIKSMQLDQGKEGSPMPLHPIQKGQLSIIQQKGSEAVTELKKWLVIEYQARGAKANPDKVLNNFFKTVIASK